MMNIDAARRQALGPHFTAVEDDAQQVTDIQAGRLRMPPYKAWALPENPTWCEDPFGDRSWQSRYHSLLWLDPLRRADVRGDDAAGELWWFLARSWVDANPPDVAAAHVAWSGATAARRALVLACGATVTGDQRWLADALAVHLDWLAEAPRSLAEAEGVNQHAALFVLGAVLDDPRAQDLAVSRLAAQLVADYDEQGVNKDGAVVYHLHNYVWWREVLQRLQLEGIPQPEAAVRLRLAPRFLAHATSPLGRFARIGDTDGGNPGRIDHPWTRFAGTGGKDGTAPDSTAAVFDAGYAFVRSGWGEDRPYHRETYVALTWGRQDKVHGHADGGSLSYAADGVQWFDDSGKSRSDHSPLRSYVVGREGHNAIVIPHREYSRDTTVELLRHEDTDDWVDLVVHDPSYRGVSIVRRVVYLKARRQVLVLDAVEADEELVIQQQWHCGRGVTARRHGAGFDLRHDGLDHRLTVLDSARSTEIRRGCPVPMAGRTSAGRGESVPVDQLVVGTRARAGMLAVQLGPRDEAVQDLIGPHLAVQTVHTPVPDLVPPPLLRTGRRSRQHHEADTTGLAVTLEIEEGGLLTAVVTGGGPLWAFYLLHPDGSVERSPYGRRSSRSFYSGELEGVLLRVYSRDSAGAITARSVPLTHRGGPNAGEHTP